MLCEQMFRIWHRDGIVAVWACRTLAWLELQKGPGTANTVLRCFIPYAIPASTNPFSSWDYSERRMGSRALYSTDPVFLPGCLFLNHELLSMHLWDSRDIAADSWCQSVAPGSGIAVWDWPRRHHLTREFEKRASWDHHLFPVYWLETLAFE